MSTATFNGLPLFLTRRASREMTTWCASNPERADQMRAAFGSDEYKAACAAERARAAAERFAASEQVLTDAAAILEARGASAEVVSALRGGWATVAQRDTSGDMTALRAGGIESLARSIASVMTAATVLQQGVSAAKLAKMQAGLAQLAAS